MPPFQTSSIRDRTAEFMAIAEKLQAQRSTVAPETNGGTSGPIKQTLQQQSEFTKRASKIGLDIHQASVKLQKLAQLAKRTSTFDDPIEEINQLTGIIKQDIKSLNDELTALQRLSAAAREGNKQSTDHSHTVVDNLRARLKDTAQEFKDVLTLRTENLKHNESRRQKFSASPNGITTPLLHRQHTNGRQSAQTLFGGSQGASTSGQASGGYQQQLLLQQQPQDTYIATRAEALHNVESTISELTTIFSQLAQMVQEQGDVALRIDDHVGQTLDNVQGAQTQLLKYLNGISSSRWLILQVFFILVVFLIIFVVFLA